MASTHAVRDAFRRLSEDKWRQDHPFSDDVTATNKVLLHPYATDAQRQEALEDWFQRYQPCLFGRIAAAENTLHFLFLDDEALQQSDQVIAERMQAARKAWWQRSISPQANFSTPAHGLVLCVASAKVSLAEPNQQLRQLAEEILHIYGCRSTKERQGEVFWENAYLQNPNDKSYVKFSFSVDFFAAAGDGRWWQDHRMPGGIGFTANSVGHMRRYREWYQHKGDQRGWLLQTAMDTISRAAATQYGRATWLRTLDSDKKPIVREVECPVSLKEKFRDYDWTRYAGHLHTDHSIRPEFFRFEADKPPGNSEWIQDFQYLYDPNTQDHLRFSQGVPISKQEVEDLVGRPEDYVKIVSPPKAKPKRPDEANIADRSRWAEVEELLNVCRAWTLTVAEKKDLGGE